MKNNLFFLALFLLGFTTVVSAQEITMFPGFFSIKYYQDDKQISRSQVETLMLADSEANQLWQKSKVHIGIGYAALGAELGFLVWELSRINNNKSLTAPLIGVLCSGAISIGFSLSASSLRRKSILKYNANKDLGSLRIGPTSDGLGLVYAF